MVREEGFPNHDASCWVPSSSLWGGGTTPVYILAALAAFNKGARFLDVRHLFAV